MTTVTNMKTLRLASSKDALSILARAIGGQSNPDTLGHAINTVLDETFISRTITTYRKMIATYLANNPDDPFRAILFTYTPEEAEIPLANLNVRDSLTGCGLIGFFDHDQHLEIMELLDSGRHVAAYLETHIPDDLLDRDATDELLELQARAIASDLASALARGYSLRLAQITTHLLQLLPTFLAEPERAQHTAQLVTTYSNSLNNCLDLISQIADIAATLGQRARALSPDNDFIPTINVYGTPPTEQIQQALAEMADAANVSALNAFANINVCRDHNKPN